jgi:hypothetical protein
MLIKVDKNLNPHTPLWQYLDLAKFVAMLETKCLWLNRTDLFIDESEAKIPKKMMSLIEEAYKKFASEGQHGVISSASEFEEYLRKNCFVNCWHRNDHQNMLFWENYGRSECSVAIKTSVESLFFSVEDNNLNGYILELRPVVYDVYTKYPDSTSIKYEDCAFIKHQEYASEDEVRIGLCTYSSIQPTKEKPKGYHLNCELSKMIEDIYVHPNSPDWFQEAFESMLRKYDINLKPKRGLDSYVS